MNCANRPTKNIYVEDVVCVNLTAIILEQYSLITLFSGWCQTNLHHIECILFFCHLQEVQEGEKEKKDEEKEKKKEVEPNFQLLENPARVMPAQLKVLTMPESCRYQPFKPVCYRVSPKWNHKLL